ncbi:SUKH-4 family immunity protein [Streptomyces sp. NPDC052701]|uniref:SUKH-4 family immunity protein n=1 Tax=Streptomyces sp. NPDC052701 TaxID=3155533 RepID=UPI003448287B
MLFDVDHELLAAVVGEDNVHLLPAETAARYGFTGEAVEFLAEVGLPDAEEFELSFALPVEFDADLVWDRASREERGWQFPDGVEHVVPVGNFPVNAVTVDPVSGIVYQYTDATKSLIPVHRDLSSLAKTMASFLGYIQAYARVDGEDDDAEYARRKREVGALMDEIQSVDPLPFAHEYSEWVEMFDNLEGGIYT